MKELVGKLCLSCKYLLQIRGDGNCFYRAISYHLLEKLLIKNEAESCIKKYIKWYIHQKAQRGCEKGGVMVS